MCRIKLHNFGQFYKPMFKIWIIYHMLQMEIRWKKICKFNVTKSIKFTKLVHLSEMNVRHPQNLQICHEI